MNRFKFRHWDKKIKQMRYGDIQLGSNGKPFIISPELPKLVQHIDDVITMQCTGLKDKNEKLIYEGDIVKNHRDEIAEVVWLKEHAAFFLDGRTDWECAWINDGISDYEIIGNIHENPELLEAAE